MRTLYFVAPGSSSPTREACRVVPGRLREGDSPSRVIWPHLLTPVVVLLSFMLAYCALPAAARLAPGGPFAARILGATLGARVLLLVVG